MKKYTHEQLIHYLKKLAKKLKRTPTIKDINDDKGLPHSSTYMNRYGTWNKALKKADLKLNVQLQYDPIELLDNIRQMNKELGRPPKAKELCGKDWTASYSTYKKYFGSWKKALYKAGIKKKTGYSSLKKFIRKKKS
ncbi:MAG: hypothetical protein KKF44_02830 [Nanoarchaeota archaeon]|nr:hypothetical protein [Nanoarchaeota archaeon]